MCKIETSYHANGKLLLTGEYYVLEGALALALPTVLGQSMQVQPTDDKLLNWSSLDHEGKEWFRAQFHLTDLEIQHSSDSALSDRLRTLFKAIQTQNSDFWGTLIGTRIETRLDFPRNWGLGTSSTLVANLAAWSSTNPYKLLAATFGGSGYDIACATAEGPLLYTIEPKVAKANFNPSFKEALYFVYLGKKQNSREGIARFRKKEKKPERLNRISEISRAIETVERLEAFDQLIQEHEQIIAQTIDLPLAKDLYFKDFWGQIKSLGAWGGDFVLATSVKTPAETVAYFNERGFTTVLRYNELIK